MGGSISNEPFSCIGSRILVLIYAAECGAAPAFGRCGRFIFFQTYRGGSRGRGAAETSLRGVGRGRDPARIGGPASRSSARGCWPASRAGEMKSYIDPAVSRP